MDRQKTIEREVSLSGIGIHTANKVNVNFKPAEENSGINFIRTDLKDKPVIKAKLDSLFVSASGMRHTSIGDERVHIQTIEHLMAVLYGLGIDNIYIEVDANELPALDGSGKEYYDLLLKAGIKEQDAEKQYYAIREPIVVEENNATLAVFPSSELKISYTLSYQHPFVKTQFLSLKINFDTFRDELVEARTFCIEDEAEEILKMGLGKGANYSNTLVVGSKGVINNTLRFEDEFVRHKIFDLIGDLYILGLSIKGHFIALRSGHNLNLKMLNKIRTQKENYSMAGVKAKGSISCSEGLLDRQQIMEILPHRDPFLFVDKILKLEKGKYALGVKYLTTEDYFFKGHFPGKPIMPGVLIIEAMAQVGGVMMLSLPQNRGKLAYFLACNNVKFRRTVLPGDELVLEVETLRLKSKTGSVKATAYVESKVVAEAELVFALVED
ncbi:MAG: UDP-3-O-acyl-N-acetylglucosamine deacetylase [Candidatus Omnitrophica bacterium]|nr:UDP-3-O-acyl-N-acetylglucosamine deacetylase [Candidatus Omnitrophota bacterium]